jgi:FkbM family methyltransferase
MKYDFQIMTFHEDDIIEHNFTPKEGDVVIDGGAYIGPYTLIASRRVGLNEIVAIEADSENFNILNRNIQLNKLTNVIASNYATYSKMNLSYIYQVKKKMNHLTQNTIQ